MEFVKECEEWGTSGSFQKPWGGMEREKSRRLQDVKPKKPGTIPLTVLEHQVSCGGNGMPDLGSSLGGWCRKQWSGAMNGRKKTGVEENFRRPKALNCRAQVW